MTRDRLERAVLELLVWAFFAAVVFGFAAMVLAGVASIREGRVARCETVQVVPAEVDCTWTESR